MRRLLEKHHAESVVYRQLEEAGDAIAALIVLYRIGLFSETGNGTAREINRQQESIPAVERIQPPESGPAVEHVQQQEPSPAVERIRVPEPFLGATPPDLVHTQTSGSDRHRFTQQEREIEIILRDTQTPFSRVSIENLREAPVLRRRLQNEMAQAVMRGESQQQLARRIERVMQNGAYNARRIAQTERTRVQSQAAWDVMVQSEQLGVNMAKKWHAKMVNTRDSHAALNGTIAPLHEPFHTIWGNDLMYPGDPSAPASEVINCHCGISPVVLRPGEKVQPTPTPSGEVASPVGNDIMEKDGFSLPLKKLSEYALNPQKSPDKANAFREALGYDRSNQTELARYIIEHIRRDDLVEKGDNGHGMRYECIMSIKGPNGKNANVLTAWLRENDRIRLTSLYVTKRKVAK